MASVAVYAASEPFRKTEYSLQHTLAFDVARANFSRLIPNSYYPKNYVDYLEILMYNKSRKGTVYGYP